MSDFLIGSDRFVLKLWHLVWSSSAVFGWRMSIRQCVFSFCKEKKILFFYTLFLRRMLRLRAVLVYACPFMSRKWLLSGLWWIGESRLFVAACAQTKFGRSEACAHAHWRDVRDLSWSIVTDSFFLEMQCMAYYDRAFFSFFVVLVG